MLSRALEYLRWRMQASPPSEPNEAPRDPSSYVRHPLVQRPGGRDAAVALEEPDEEETLMLVGHY
jgi:hypothetical protein